MTPDEQGQLKQLLTKPEAADVDGRLYDVASVAVRSNMVGGAVLERCACAASEHLLGVQAGPHLDTMAIMLEPGMLRDAYALLCKATGGPDPLTRLGTFLGVCFRFPVEGLIQWLESDAALKVIGLTDSSGDAFPANLCAVLKDKVKRGALQAQLASYREVVEAKYDGCLAAMAAHTRQQVTEAMEAVAEAGYSDEAVLVAKRAVVGASVGGG